jgi:hypothetical protein
MVKGMVIDPATQPFAGSIAWAKCWRFNGGMSDPTPGNDPNAAYDVAPTQGWPHW